MWKGQEWEKEDRVDSAESSRSRKENQRGMPAGTDGCPVPQACCTGPLVSVPCGPLFPWCRLITSYPRAKDKSPSPEEPPHQMC